MVISTPVTSWLLEKDVNKYLVVLGINIDAEDKADVGYNDEDTNDEEYSSFENLSKLN